MDEPVVAAEIVDHYEQDYDESHADHHRLRRRSSSSGPKRSSAACLPPGPLRIARRRRRHRRARALAGRRPVTGRGRRPDAAARRSRGRARGRGPRGHRRARRRACAPARRRAPFDVVLLLGPLYHLDRTRRPRAGVARSVTRREAGRPRDRGRGQPLRVVVQRPRRSACSSTTEFRAIVEQDLRDGQHRNPDRTPHWFTTAYFHHPDELEAEVAEARR